MTIVYASLFAAGVALRFFKILPCCVHFFNVYHGERFYNVYARYAKEDLWTIIYFPRRRSHIFIIARERGLLHSYVTTIHGYPGYHSTKDAMKVYKRLRECKHAYNSYFDARTHASFNPKSSPIFILTLPSSLKMPLSNVYLCFRVHPGAIIYRRPSRKR